MHLSLHIKESSRAMNYIRYTVIGTLIQLNIAAFNKTKNSHNVRDTEIICNAKCFFIER